MAIKLKDIYAYITGASAAYPWGSFKNASAGGAGDGTPFEKQWPNDIYGFLQALLSKAGIVPSGAPDTAETSQYLQAIQYLISQSVPAGVSYFSFLAASPAGFLELNGGTIGDGASGASERANADAQALFTGLWAHSSLQLYTSAGVASARGANAAADWAAHRRLAIPDMRGVTPRGWDHGRGLDPGRLMASYQADAQQNITGGFAVDDSVIGTGTGAFYNAGSTPSVALNNDSSQGGEMGLDASRQIRTADEVRVKSVAGMWIIKL